jgi:hypothetical protein
MHLFPSEQGVEFSLFFGAGFVSALTVQCQTF